jgi:hypothetical protein
VFHFVVLFYFKNILNRCLGFMTLIYMLKKRFIIYSMEGLPCLLYLIYDLSNVSQEFHSAQISSDIKAINHSNKTELLHC